MVAAHNFTWFGFGMNRPRILQLFNRYEQFGGEEGSVIRIGDAQQAICQVENLITSTKDFLGGGSLDKALLPFRALHNHRMAKRLRGLQQIGRFQAWQVHNAFPTMSPSVYATAFELGVPVVHYLHSYRFSCVNGFFMNHGQPCQRCLGGNFTSAVTTGCWRNSRILSGMMALVLLRTRQVGLFEKTARWIALSRAQKDLHIAMGIPGDRIDIVPHFYEAQTSPAPAPSEPSSALFVGRLSSEKGVDHLLEAWHRLRRPDLILLIAGDGPERPALETQAARLGLNNVKFLGFVEKGHHPALWAQTSFSLAPSVWPEPFGMVILEAWANARPVVAYANGAFPELIEHGKTGRLARTGDIDDLATQIESMFASPIEARSMGAAGHETLLKRFSRARWLTDMASVYRNIGIECPCPQ